MTAGVWLYKAPTDSVSASELRYSIRSAVKHLGVDQVYLIGERPEWAVNVGHIPGGPVAGSKYRQLFDDLQLACESDELPAEFLLMNDDFHALRPYEPAVEHGGLLADRCEWLGDAPGAFVEAFVHTLGWLRLQGHTEPLTYDLHRPLPMRKDSVRAALSAAQSWHQTLHARTVYGALCGIEGDLVGDRKLHGNLDSDDWRSLDLVSTSESAWQASPGDWLRSLSPEPSPFER